MAADIAQAGGRGAQVKPDSCAITVVIPTFRREQVLVETIEYLLALSPPPAEIIVVDQTEQHEPGTAQQLRAWHARGAIHWVQRKEASIPKAMNAGLRCATQDIVLFLDDDIRPEPGLLTSHLRAHTAHGDALIAGRVIQPWQEGVDFSADTGIHFASLRPAWMKEFMGGNFSIQRQTALALGGFDENFVRVAYRFEAEFAYRFLATGRRIRYEPAACLHHLKVAAGGTRTFGDHLTTWRPDHAVGAYYYSLRTGAWLGFVTRPIRAVATRHHLRHPWQIFRTLVAELKGMAWAARLHRSGPRYLTAVDAEHV
jgi:GT2 family glycosyltransferase